MPLSFKYKVFPMDPPFIFLNIPSTTTEKLRSFRQLLIKTLNNQQVRFTVFLDVNSTLVGLTLLYCLQLGGLFQWTVRQSAQVESLVSF